HGLLRRGRANRGEDRETPGRDARVPSVHQCLPSRRWRVETGPPPRRPDNGAPGCGVRHREGSLRLPAGRCRLTTRHYAPGVFRPSLSLMALVERLIVANILGWP